MARYAELADGRVLEFPDETTDEVIDQTVMSLMSDSVPQVQEELDPYADERTALGQAGEFGKGAVRGFAGSFLTAAEGLAELADAGTNALGFEDLIDSGDENALVSAAKAGQEILQENLGASDAYRDQWLTKFGEGVGSFASFFTPAGLVKGLGLTGKLASGVQLGAAGTLAGGVGAGEQAQRIQRARDQGIEVSEEQEDASIGFGSGIGLLELAPVRRILGRISNNAKPEFVNSIKERLKSASKSGIEEGVQEVLSNILQDAVERGVYNENLESDMSLEGMLTSDEFTIGGASGFAADLILNSVANRRGKLANQAEKDHENLLRAEQDKRIADGRQAVTELQQQEAEEAQKQAEAEVTGEVYVPPVQSLEGLQPIPRPAESTTGNIDYEHADAIKLALGRNFPTEGSFDARVTDNGTYEIVANLPDIDGAPQEKVVADNLETADQAGIVSGRLNQKVIDANISRTVNKVIDNAQPIENYNLEQKDTLAVVGDTIMHPNSPTTLIPATRLNSAAETTVEKGFREDLSATQVMQLIAQGENIPMTAAQKLNESRVMRGLPEKADFTLKEIRESGLVPSKKFDQFIPSLAPASSFSADTQVEVFEPKNADGTPELKSDGTPVRKRRATHTVIGKDEQGNDVRITTRPRTASEVETGSKFTPKNRPVKIKSAKEAKAIAAEMNASSGLGRKFQNVQGELVDLSTAKTPKQKLAVINQVLDSKNISNDINSPEMGVVVEQFVGAKPKRVESLKASEFQAVVAGLRSLPRFNSPTKIPKFTVEESAKPAPIPSAIPREMSLVPFTPVDVSPIEEVLPEAQVADINALRKRLRQTMNSFGLKDIGFILENSLTSVAKNSNGDLVFGVATGTDTADGSRYAERLTPEESAERYAIAEAMFDPATSTIFSAIDTARSESAFEAGQPATEKMIEDRLISTLHHEMLHAMRNLDLFTQQEWRLLTDYVTNTKRPSVNQTYLEEAQERYSDQSLTVQVEEAVAELVRDAVDGTVKVSGKPRSLINRIVEFFKGMIKSTSGENFTTIESLVGGIKSGAVGGRARGVQRTLLETERQLGVPQYDSRTGTTSFAQADQPEVTQTGQSMPDFVEPDEGMASRRRSSSPIQSAVDRATTKYADYNTAVEEEFFGNFWPKMMQEVGGTVSPDKVRTASKRALRDVQKFVAENPKYQDYYAEDMRAVRLALSEDYGDISDGDLLFYQMANGLSSPATSLPSNVGDAVNVFDLYKKEGNLESIELGTSPKGNVVVASSPFSISGTTGPTKARSLKVFDRLIAEKGGAVEAVEFLREGVSPKELQKFNREMGYKSNVSGMGAIKSLVQQATGQNESIPRMFIFGKKIGAYTLNLTGDSRYTTIDVWESRFIRSYFDGLFRQNTGLPANVSEDQLFQDFSTMFKEEYDKVSGTKADPAALQAMRWFYMINAAKQSGYQGASTNETISELTNKYLTKTRKRRNAGRAEGDGATAQEVRDPSQAREESLDQPLASLNKLDSPEIQSAVDAMNEIPATTTNPAYGTKRWSNIRPVIVEENGQMVEKKGYGAAVNHLMAVSEQSAWTDDGMQYPEGQSIATDRKAIIFMGLPASGKSTVANPIARDLSARIVDPDQAKEVFPEFADGVGANAVHEESKVLSDALTLFAMDKGENLVIPTIGHGQNKIMSLASSLKDQGYTVELVNVEVTPENAIDRMVSRFNRTGRLIPPDYINAIMGKPKQVYDAIKQEDVFNGYAEIDNNPALDQPRIVTESTTEAFDGREGLRLVGMGQGDGRGGATDAGQVLVQGTTGQDAESIDQPLASRSTSISEFIKSNPEGFTVDPNTFETPTGVAVAPIKNLEVRVLPEEITDDVIDQAVRNFKAMADTLDQPVYLGGWFSSEDGYYYLDGSITVDSVEEALYIAEAGDQLGIFDLNTFEETLTNEGIRKLKENGTYDDKAAGIARRNKEELDRIFGAQGNTGQAQQEGATRGINVATDGNTNYADLIVSGQKRFETRDSDSLRPYVGKRVGIIETKRGQKAQLVGYATVGEPEVVGQSEFDASRELHLVPEGSKFDIKQGQNKWLYEMKDPEKLPQPIDASKTTGIVARDIQGITGRSEAQEFLSKGSTPRDNITTIPEEAIEAVVEKNIVDAEATTATSIPLYSVKAEPRAQYVAQNPEKGSKILDEGMYSRSRSPEYSPEAQAEIGSLVNSTAPDKTAREVYLEASNQSSIREMLTRFKQKAINKYARLEQVYTDPNLGFRDVLADASAMAAALFADRAQGVSSAAIKGGVVTYNNGITKVEKFVHNGKEYRGLIDVMAPLVQNNYNVNLEELAQAYAVAVRSQRLAKEGKETPAGAKSLAVLEAEIAKYTNPETGQPIIKEWYSAWQAYNAKTIQFLRDTGVLDAETAQVWADQSDYVPFYRQLEEEGGSQMPPVFTGMTSAANFKALKGGDTAVNVPLLEAVTRNLNAAIHMGMRNVAQQRIVRDMVKVGLGYEVKGDMKAQNVIAFRVNGKNRKFSISDPLIYESMQGMGSGEIETILTNIVGVPSTVLRELITRDPAFMVVNMMRDTLSTFVTSGANFTPVVDTLKNFNSGADLLEQYGVVGGYDFGNDPKDIYGEFSKEVKKRNGLGINPFVRMWDFLGQKTTQSDAATRKSVYDDVLARTGNEAEAAFQALEVINFSRRGSSSLARVVTAAIPFLNARFQGLDVLWRSSRGRYNANKDKSKAEQTRNFMFRGLMLTGLSAAYWLMVSDDDQYKERSEFERDNNFILPNPFSDKYPLMLPIPFEVGLIFKTLPERILGVANKETNFVEDVLGLEGRDKTTMKEAVDSTVRGVTSTLEINPLGAQFVAPIIEASLNYNFFTGKPVESVFMNENNLEKGFRQRVGSSQMAIMLGESLNISPIKIDHVMQGYSGTLGIYALNALDTILRTPDLLGGDNPLKVEGSDQLASMTLDRAPFLKRFLGSEFGRKNMDDYYDIRSEVKRTVGTLNSLIGDGKVDQYQKYLKGREHIVGLAGNVNYLDGLLKTSRRQIEAIQTAEDITPERKAEIIREIEQARSEYLKQVPVLKEALNSPAKLPAVGGLYRD